VAGGKLIVGINLAVMSSGTLMISIVYAGYTGLKLIKGLTFGCGGLNLLWVSSGRFNGPFEMLGI